MHSVNKQLILNHQYIVILLALDTDFIIGIIIRWKKQDMMIIMTGSDY